MYDHSPLPKGVQCHIITSSHPHPPPPPHTHSQGGGRLKYVEQKASTAKHSSKPWGSGVVRKPTSPYKYIRRGGARSAFDSLRNTRLSESVLKPALHCRSAIMSKHSELIKLLVAEHSAGVSEPGTHTAEAEIMLKCNKKTMSVVNLQQFLPYLSSLLLLWLLLHAVLPLKHHAHSVGNSSVGSNQLSDVPGFLITIFKLWLYILAHPLPSHLLPSHPLQSHPLQSHPLPSHPLQSRPLPSFHLMNGLAPLSLLCCWNKMAIGCTW